MACWQALKTHRQPFQETWMGRKPFEVRANTDRIFRSGDMVTLHEWDERTDEPTGRRIVGTIMSLVVGGRGPSPLPEGITVFGLHVAARLEKGDPPIPDEQPLGRTRNRPEVKP